MGVKTLTRAQRILLTKNHLNPDEYLFVKEMFRSIDGSKKVARNSPKEKVYVFINKETENKIELKED